VTTLKKIVSVLRQHLGESELNVIGHRVVHGGDFYKEATRIDCGVLDRIEELVPLAPLHNPSHLVGIRTLQTLFPGVPQFAVFDTAFHQTMPPESYRYALPEGIYTQYKIRRYGFHGTSHRFVAQHAAERLDKPLSELRLITAHLGNGCSACAIKFGKSVDTTMGLTPQEGMMMGTRSGDVDPALHTFLAKLTNRNLDEINDLLSKQSGLLGVSGSTNDMLQLERLANKGNERAELAINLFCYRAAKGILSASAALDQLDALIFTAGIGENSSVVRKKITEHLGVLQIKLNESANQTHGADSNGLIAKKGTPPVLVVNTDEELAIAQEVSALLQRR
jgi:acetate kinase